jgi:hypothetical protein
MKILAFAAIVAAAVLVSGCATKRTVCAPTQPMLTQAPPPVMPPPMRPRQLDK